MVLEDVDFLMVSVEEQGQKRCSCCFSTGVGS